MRLHQREHLEHLVERTEAAGKHDGARAVFDEHGLAHKEVAEVHAQIHVFIEPLLVRKLNTQTNRLAVDARRSPVGRLHDAGAAAGDNRHAALSDLAADGARRLVDRVRLGRAGAAEDGHRGAELGKRAEAVDKLSLDAQHAPRIGMQPVGRLLGRQQVGVGVVLRNHRAAHDHGAAAVRLVVGGLALDVLILNHEYSYRKKKTGGVDAMRQTPARTSTIRYGTHDASSACKLSVSGRADGVSECDDRLMLDHCRCPRSASARAALSNPPRQDCSSSRSQTRRSDPR